MGVIFCYWISITVSFNSSQIWTRVELFDNLLLETMSKYFQLNYISVHHLQIIFLCILPIQWAKWGSLRKGGGKLLKLKPFHGPCAQFRPIHSPPFSTLFSYFARCAWKALGLQQPSPGILASHWAQPMWTWEEGAGNREWAPRLYFSRSLPTRSQRMSSVPLANILPFQCVLVLVAQ